MYASAVTSTVWTVTSTAPSREQALAIARAAVKARLAAGAEVTGPADTVYWHEGELGEGQEWRVTCRTSEETRDALAELIGRHHPWSNPEITAQPVAWATKPYADWVARTTAPAPGL